MAVLSQADLDSWWFDRMGGSERYDPLGESRLWQRTMYLARGHIQMPRGAYAVHAHGITSFMYLDMYGGLSNDAWAKHSEWLVTALYDEDPEGEVFTGTHITDASQSGSGPITFRRMKRASAVYEVVYHLHEGKEISKPLYLEVSPDANEELAAEHMRWIGKPGSSSGAGDVKESRYVPVGAKLHHPGHGQDIGDMWRLFRHPGGETEGDNWMVSSPGKVWYSWFSVQRLLRRSTASGVAICGKQLSDLASDKAVWEELIGCKEDVSGNALAIAKRLMQLSRPPGDGPALGPMAVLSQADLDSWWFDRMGGSERYDPLGESRLWQRTMYLARGHIQMPRGAYAVHAHGITSFMYLDMYGGLSNDAWAKHSEWLVTALYDEDPEGEVFTGTHITDASQSGSGPITFRRMKRASAVYEVVYHLHEGKEISKPLYLEVSPDANEELAAEHMRWIGKPGSSSGAGDVKESRYVPVGAKLHHPGHGQDIGDMWRLFRHPGGETEGDNWMVSSPGKVWYSWFSVQRLERASEE